MQNDLISRSELIETLRKEAEECEEAMCSPNFWSALRIVKEQPKAYDVEKVIEELEREIESYQSECAWNYAKGLEYALEIVRNGGKE